jgi:hypothetical protein
MPLLRMVRCSLLWVTAPSPRVRTEVFNRIDVVIADEASAAPTPVIIKKAIVAARQDLNMARCPWELLIGDDRPVSHREM